jgi:hypothetical protein
LAAWSLTLGGCESAFERNLQFSNLSSPKSLPRRFFEKSLIDRGEKYHIFDRYDFSWPWQIDDHHLQELQDVIQSLRGSESPTLAHLRPLKFSDSTPPEKMPSSGAFSWKAFFFRLVLVL